jgi:hypothetical protein
MKTKGEYIRYDHNDDSFIKVTLNDTNLSEQAQTRLHNYLFSSTAIKLHFEELLWCIEDVDDVYLLTEFFIEEANVEEDHYRNDKNESTVILA